MKTNLSLACIALLLFSAQVSAQKLPPPGAYGRSNVLLMIDVGGEMIEVPAYFEDGYVGGAIRLPSDVAVDSKGNVHVKNNAELVVAIFPKRHTRHETTRVYPPTRGISKLSPELKPISTYAHSVLSQGLFVDNLQHRNNFLNREVYSKMAVDAFDNTYVAYPAQAGTRDCCGPSAVGVRYVNVGSSAGIIKYDSDGLEVARMMITSPTDDVEFETIMGIDVDAKGNIWLARKKVDSSWWITKLDASGTLLKEWEAHKGIDCYDATTGAGWGRPGTRTPVVGCGVYGDLTGISVYDGKVYVLQNYRYRYDNDLNSIREHSNLDGAVGALTGDYFDCKLGFPVTVYDDGTGVQLDQWWGWGKDDIEVTANGVYVVGHTSFHLSIGMWPGTRTRDLQRAFTTLNYLWDDPIPAYQVPDTARIAAARSENILTVETF